ncbi:hypothetical protein JX265_005430 [Neoarthrinium moseri]|uniref:Manganese/iron superoxide dismutase C-terminal domain-containing protein n=1 Tax=Neoarthrinium moseri TaxID=1658444 RepID=A0A9P9WNJ9_9PEZI|nr:uncharacterized protein JN550_009350 [Neoarthrinium moseri]KAI1845275.1 hypothetical protein JX266_008585 [Neoarthrinium moseri]KAI1863852.1 hypothetical protein JN550_009350 [Neoarthrinium moseri]KAI1872550.1 hypothetical protein JX265_005430 [Neoarthrinium moseri]
MSAEVDEVEKSSQEENGTWVPGPQSELPPRYWPITARTLAGLSARFCGPIRRYRIGVQIEKKSKLARHHFELLVLRRASRILPPQHNHTMFRTRLRIPRVSLPRQRPAAAVFRRSLHDVPTVGYSGAEGIPGLLSPDGFDLAYTQYMQFVTEKLNSLIADTDLERMETRHIISRTAREPSQAPIFNYASMAFNNHFFFKNLKPKEDPRPDGSDAPNPIPEKLKAALELSFSSMETLRLEMTLTANAMFGPGFVWLVKLRKSDQYRILTTYLAGSPFPDAHWRRQGVDTNTVSGPSSSEQDNVAQQFFGRSQLGAGAANGSMWAKNQAPGGIDVTPILCLNTWEHVWLRDYGIGAGGYGGKRLYVDNWWQCINWENVMEAAQLRDRNLYASK